MSEQSKYKLKKGQSVFEINLISGRIIGASFRKLNGIDTKLIERKDCIYLPALNKAHAKKLFDNICGTFESTTIEDLKKEVELKNEA